jgi:hypothetical protein
MGSGTLQAAGQIGGVIQSGIQLADSLTKMKRNKRELERLQPVFYKVQDEYYQNRNMAQNLAQGGMPQATKDYFTSESQRGLGAGIQGILSGGGDAENIAQLFDGYNRSINNAAAQDAQMRVDNVGRLMAANKDVAGQETMKWTLNDYQPYQAKLKQLTQNVANAETNMWGAASGVAQGLSSLGTSMSNQGDYNDLFRTGQSSGGLPAPNNTAAMPITSAQQPNTSLQPSSMDFGSLNQLSLFQQYLNRPQ